MWEIFKEIHQNMMNWANSDKSDNSKLDYAIKLSDATKSKSLSKSLKKLKKSSKSSWEDSYIDAENRLAEAMAEYDS